jgi:pilus assembly protein Flp/PilA
MRMAIAAVSTSGARAPRISPEKSDMKNLLVRFVRDEEGQDIIEYALLGAFISIIAVAAITLIGTDVNTIYENIQGVTSDAAGG